MALMREEEFSVSVRKVEQSCFPKDWAKRLLGE